MEKPGKKLRDIRFRSEKNGQVMVVHSEAARAYSKYLEENEDVSNYEAGRPLDTGRLKSVPRVDIRGDYFKQTWMTDFCIRYQDGTVGVREIICTSDLNKRAEVEKLELSRRYWSLMGVKDWKVVVIRQESKQL